MADNPIITEDRLTMDDRSVLLCDECLDILNKDYDLRVLRTVGSGCTSHYQIGSCSKMVCCDNCRGVQSCPMELSRTVVEKKGE